MLRWILWVRCFLVEWFIRTTLKDLSRDFRAADTIRSVRRKRQLEVAAAKEEAAGNPEGAAELRRLIGEIDGLVGFEEGGPDVLPTSPKPNLATERQKKSSKRTDQLANKEVPGTIPVGKLVSVSNSHGNNGEAKKKRGRPPKTEDGCA